MRSMVPSSKVGSGESHTTASLGVSGADVPVVPAPTAGAKAGRAGAGAGLNCWGGGDLRKPSLGMIGGPNWAAAGVARPRITATAKGNGWRRSIVPFLPCSTRNTLGCVAWQNGGMGRLRPGSGTKRMANSEQRVVARNELFAIRHSLFAVQFPHHHHMQPARAMRAEDQRLLDVGRARRAGDQ